MISSVCIVLGQEKNKPVYYDNWPTQVPANRDILKIKSNNTPNFVPLGTVWNKRILTYFFTNGTADMTGNTEHDAVRLGFTYWSNAAAIRFIEVCNVADADIVISWATGHHGDDPFDGVDGTLAHAAGPPPNPFAGLLHFDDDETWVNAIRPNGSQPIDLVTVAAHEIGHVLGLDHTTVSGSLMLPNYTGSHRYLGSDDLAGIVSLYGTTHAFVSGPSLICSSASYGIVDYLPSSATISWSSSNATILSINSSTGVATRVGSSYGSVTITATINSGCTTGTIVFTKKVWVGPPNIFTAYYDSGIPASTMNYVSAGSHVAYLELSNLIPAELIGNVSWNPSPSIGFGFDQYFHKYDFTLSSGQTLYLNPVSATNACETSNRTLAFAAPSGFLVYPNPASAYLNIQFENVSELEVLPLEIKLLSEKSTIPIKAVIMEDIFKNNMFRDGNKVVLDVSALDKGIYYVHIVHRDQKRDIDVIRVLIE